MKNPFNRETEYIKWIQMECFLSTPEQATKWIASMRRIRSDGEFYRTLLMQIQEQKRSGANEVIQTLKDSNFVVEEGLIKWLEKKYEIINCSVVESVSDGSDNN